MAGRILNRQLDAKLEELIQRPNNEYNRGVLHGFLLAMNTQGKIDNYEAVEILEEFGRK